MKKYRLLIVFAFLFLLKAGPVFAFPFHVGERLEYDLSWSGIAAGFTTFEVIGVEGVNGGEAYHLASRSLSNSFVSTFYEVDEQIDSYLDRANLYSQGIKVIQQRDDRRRKKEIYFDQKLHEAVYIKNGEQSIHKIESSVQDSLSSFYYIRTQNLSIGDEIRINTFENGKSYEITAKVLQREKIKVPAGTFNTIKVSLIIKHKEKLKNKGESLIWLSDNEYKFPVKIKTKISVGYITAKLKKMKKGENNGNR
ncbi:MAG: DUF3108 domain-containing protein [Proteobacteria bacterium]|nr:DUF3108 domain-containing protein [Pseudomonadota bacterium]